MLNSSRDEILKARTVRSSTSNINSMGEKTRYSYVTPDRRYENGGRATEKCLLQYAYLVYM